MAGHEFPNRWAGRELDMWPGDRRSKNRGRKNLINKLLHRDGKCCWFCGVLLGEDITVEHVVARSLGGSNRLANLVLAHAKCNQLHADRPWQEKVVHSTQPYWIPSEKCFMVYRRSQTQRKALRKQEAQEAAQVRGDGWLLRKVHP